jgi:hypothetical protein
MQRLVPRDDAVRVSEQLLVMRRFDESLERSVEALWQLASPSKSFSREHTPDGKLLLNLPPHVCSHARCPCSRLMVVVGQALFESGRGGEYLQQIFRLYGGAAALPFDVLCLAAQLQIALGRGPDVGADLLASALDTSVYSASERERLSSLLRRCEQRSVAAPLPVVANSAVSALPAPLAAAAAVSSLPKTRGWSQRTVVGVVAAVLALLGLWRARKGWFSLAE